jgi:hypothetical protein
MNIPKIFHEWHLEKLEKNKTKTISTQLKGKTKTKGFGFNNTLNEEKILNIHKDVLENFN